jgi:hypothetical protein
VIPAAVGLSAAAAVQTAGAKSANGALGLLFVLLLGIAVAFLLRSMNKHLRRAQRMKIEEQELHHNGNNEPTDQL